MDRRYHQAGDEMKRRLRALGLALALWAPASDSWAGRATGHEWISGIAIEKLPESVPEFIRTPEAIAEIAVLGREPQGELQFVRNFA